ncbi:MAG: hypothetical protein WC867_01595 [Candidatus Pacearchaeota archaeon]|jgi:hypothetical protein
MKKAQAWGIDISVGIIIFILGIIVFFIYTLNGSNEANENLEELNLNGDYIMNTILSEGFPSNWTLVDVTKIGILKNDKIDQEKIENFYNISRDNYTLTLALFDTKYNYYFFFENMTIHGNDIEGFGKPGVNSTSINSKNLIKITRHTVYSNKPKTVYLYIWEE